MSKHLSKTTVTQARETLRAWLGTHSLQHEDVCTLLANLERIQGSFSYYRFLEVWQEILSVPVGPDH